MGARSQIDIQVSSNRDDSHIGKSPTTQGIPFALTFGLDTPFSDIEIHNSTKNTFVHNTFVENWAIGEYFCRKLGN